MSESPASFEEGIDLHPFGWEATREALPLTPGVFFDKSIGDELKVTIKVRNVEQPDGQSIEVFAMVAGEGLPDGSVIGHGYTITDGVLIAAGPVHASTDSQKGEEYAPTTHQAEREAGFLTPSLEDVGNLFSFIGKVIAN